MEETQKQEVTKALEWTQTYSGRKLNPTRLLSEQVFRVDVEHALSMKCRYNGHCRKFYSVSEHSVSVAAIRGMRQILMCDEPTRVLDDLAIDTLRNPGELQSDKIRDDFRLRVIEAAYRGADQTPVQAQAFRRALLHDASEYALIDVPTPLKREMPEYKIWEKIAEIAIFDRFEVLHERDAVTGKTCDVAALFAEKSRLLLHRVDGWGAEIPRDTYSTIAAELIFPRCKLGLSPKKAKKLFRRAWDILEIGG